MPPSLRPSRRKGGDDGEPPAGLPWSLYVPAALAVFLLWNFRGVVLDYAMGRRPRPEPSAVGLWEGMYSVPGRPPTHQWVRLCVKEHRSFAMLWLSDGWTFAGHLVGTWSLEGRTLRLVEERRTGSIPPSARSFVLTHGDGATAFHATLEGIAIDPPTATPRPTDATAPPTELIHAFVTYTDCDPP